MLNVCCFASVLPVPSSEGARPLFNSLESMRGKKQGTTSASAAAKTKLSGGGKAYDPDAPFTARDVWQMATTLLIALLLGRYALLPLLEWYRDSRYSHLGTESCAS